MEGEAVTSAVPDCRTCSDFVEKIDSTWAAIRDASSSPDTAVVSRLRQQRLNLRGEFRAHMVGDHLLATHHLVPMRGVMRCTYCGCTGVDTFDLCPQTPGRST